MSMSTHFFRTPVPCQRFVDEMGEDVVRWTVDLRPITEWRYMVVVCSTDEINPSHVRHE